jgi:isopenicillin N synthase-like dioxygenase
VPDVPVLDVSALRSGATDDLATLASALDAACRDVGFFCIRGHGIDPARTEELVGEARRFFARPDGEKAAIGMDRGGRAWRGWFPVGGELTSGIPDQKEGVRCTVPTCSRKTPRRCEPPSSGGWTR